MTASYVEMQISASHIDPQFRSTFIPDMINSFVTGHGAKVRRMVLISGWFHIGFEVADLAVANDIARTIRLHGWPAEVREVSEST